VRAPLGEARRRGDAAGKIFARRRGKEGVTPSHRHEIFARSGRNEGVTPSQRVTKLERWKAHDLCDDSPNGGSGGASIVRTGHEGDVTAEKGCENYAVERGTGRQDAALYSKRDARRYGFFWVRRQFLERFMRPLP
jgi:hypothetical protein